MSFIEIRKLWKEYGPQVVLENISLEFEKNAFVSLVGPSGCGKSTFLRMLLGQESPTRGQIFFEGERNRSEDNFANPARMSVN